MIQKTYYFARYKKTGEFFFWHELCSDGYGIYCPHHTNFDCNSLPTFFDKPEFPDGINFYSEYSDRDKYLVDKKDIEFIPLEIKF